MHRKRTSAIRGAAMIIALEVVFLIVGIATILIQRVTSENTSTDAMVLESRATYFAESGTEYAIKQITQALASKKTLPEPFAAGWTADGSLMRGYVPGFEPAATGQPQRSTITWKVFQLEASERIVIDPDGVNHAYQLYAVTARGFAPDPVDPDRYSEIYVNKIVDTDKIPLFQYLAFYNKYDLEILPGPDATFKGRVHSNRDIYIGVGAGSKMTMNTNSLLTSGALRRHRKDEPTTAGNYYMTGTVRVRRKNAAETSTVNDANFPILAGRGQIISPSYSINVPTAAAPNGYDSSFQGYDGNSDGDVTDGSDMRSFSEGSKARWEGTIQIGSDGVPELAAPDLSTMQAFVPASGTAATHKYNATTKTWDKVATGGTSKPGYYQANADLVVHSNGSITKLYDKGGTLVYEWDAAANAPKAGGINLLVDQSTGAPITPIKEASIFDQREYKSADDAASAGKVKVIDIDISKLNNARRIDTNELVFPTGTTAGTLIYAYRTDTTAKDPRGVRLTNGTELNNKMTVVSEAPIYIKGNFNTVNKKGSAIMSDATSLLGNEWSDTKSSTSSLPVPATDLIVNAAIITGAYETLPGKYNGGFENFPRFHEDWSASGRTVKIRGSFVSLYESTFAKGTWVYGGNYYTAPKRDWDFDTDLLKKEFLPPGFPVSVSARRTVWWKNRDLAWWPL
jgi:hypothetical protein